MNKLLKPVREHKGPLYENVALQLEALISQGHLKEGAQLPSEREMTEIFGVSRTCIREAIKSLVAKNLIKVEHGKGVFVVPVVSNEEEFAQMMMKLFPVNKNSMRDICDFRKLIEPKAAAWAASRRTEQEAEALLKCFDADKEDWRSANIIKIWDHDTKFHLAIMEASHNRVLPRIVRGMLDLLAESRRNTFQVEGRPLKSLEEHVRIAEAIRNRDEAAAERYMLEHLQNVEIEVARLYTEEDDQ